MKIIEIGLRNGWPAPNLHCFCLLHIKANFRKEVHDSVSEKWFYQASIATHEMQYNEIWEKISRKGHEYIERSLAARRLEQ